MRESTRLLAGQFAPAALLLASALAGAAALASSGSLLGILVIHDWTFVLVYLVALMSVALLAYRVLLTGHSDRQAQQAFRDAMAATHRAALLRCLMDNATDAILVLGWRGRVQSCNPAAARLFGCPAAELIDLTLSELLQRLEPDQAASLLEMVNGRPGGSIDLPVRIGEDGSLLTLSLSRTVFRSARNEHERRREDRSVTVCTFRTMSDSTADEPEAAAETAMRVQAELMASMSHELRTPLNAIIGFAELLEHLTDRLDGRGRHYVRHIRDSGHRLLCTITDILAFVQIEAGTFPLQRRTVDVAAAVEAAVAGEDADAVGRDVAFEIAVEDGLPALHTDAAVLHHMLRHLLAHATRLTRDGGTVGVQARRGRAGSVELVVEAGTAPLRRPVPVGLPGPTRTGGLGIVLARSLAKLSDAEFAMTESADGRTGCILRFPPRCTDAPVARSARGDGLLAAARR